jgi:hypothetical protein
MNKKVLGTLVLGLSCAAILAPMASEASEKEASTDVGIKFETDDDTTLVPGPFGDALSLNAKPTQFSFGTAKAANNSSATYEQQKGATKQYLSVFEDRDTVTTDWNVEAKMSALKNTDTTNTENKELQATLRFDSSAVSSFVEPARDADGNLPMYIPVPGESELTALTGVDAKVTGNKDVQLIAGGGSVKVLEGKQDAGKGGFASEIKNVRLAVAAQGKLSGQEFTGNVTWTLNDTI